MFNLHTGMSEIEDHLRKKKTKNLQYVLGIYSTVVDSSAWSVFFKLTNDKMKQECVHWATQYLHALRVVEARQMAPSAWKDRKRKEPWLTLVRALFSSKFWQRLTSAGVGRSFWRIPKKACVLGSIVWAEGSTNSFEKSLNMSERWNRMKTNVKWMVALQHRTAIFGQWSDVLHLRIIKPKWRDVEVKIPKKNLAWYCTFQDLVRYTNIHKWHQWWSDESSRISVTNKRGERGERGSEDLPWELPQLGIFGGSAGNFWSSSGLRLPWPSLRALSMSIGTNSASHFTWYWEPSA